MNWLGEHMRDQLMGAASTDARQNVANFPADAAVVSRSGTSSALDLVSEAAGVIRGIQERAAESEARAKALAEGALEKLQVAVSRIQSAEAARGSAQETISELSAKLQEAEQELARTQSRIVCRRTSVGRRRAADTDGRDARGQCREGGEPDRGCDSNSTGRVAEKPDRAVDPCSVKGLMMRMQP